MPPRTRRSTAGRPAERFDDYQFALSQQTGRRGRRRLATGGRGGAGAGAGAALRQAQLQADRAAMPPPPPRTPAAGGAGAGAGGAGVEPMEFSAAATGHSISEEDADFIQDTLGDAEFTSPPPSALPTVRSAGAGPVGPSPSGLGDVNEDYLAESPTEYTRESAARALEGAGHFRLQTANQFGGFLSPSDQEVREALTATGAGDAFEFSGAGAGAPCADEGGVGSFAAVGKAAFAPVPSPPSSGSA